MPPAYKCKKEGHVWIEVGGLLYTRNKDRAQGTVAVTCKYCLKAENLPAHSRHTAQPPEHFLKDVIEKVPTGRDKNNPGPGSP